MSIHRSDRKPLGKAGVEVAPVFFGTTVLGNLFTAPSDVEKRALIRSWIDAIDGPVCLDSAGKYGAGMALETLGRELTAAGINSDGVLLSNKLAWRRTPLTGPEPTFEPGVWKNLGHDAVQDISRDGILRCHEDGLMLLGGWQPQLLAVHDPDEYLAAATNAGDRLRRLNEIVDALNALSELRDAGEACGIGVGSKDWTVIRELTEIVRLDWVMMANSFTIMQHPPELVAFLNQLHLDEVGVINSAILHGGFLTGGSFCDYRAIDASNPEDQRKLEFRERLKNVCDDHDLSVFDVCAAFGRCHPAITSLALSSSDPSRTRSLVHAATWDPPREFWASICDAGLIRSDCCGSLLGV